MSWITEGADKGRRMDNYYSFNGIELYIMHPLPSSVKIEDVLSIISSKVPNHLQRGVDVIYVGQFKDLIDREVNALFQHGAIYLTNDQTDVSDMVDDIVHEMAHSVEKEHPDLIFEDGRLFKEFLGKRRRLTSILEAEGFDVDPIFRSRVEYNSDIDDFLYKEVGYPLLNNLVLGLFPSAYATTSLREYFAIGFEEFFIGDRPYLKKICPILYSKIESLASLGES